ncbi:FimV/HubP family polar landmark protein, partial [Vibrio viridaestus]
AGEELPELSEDDLLEEAASEPSELADADESGEPGDAEPEDVLAELADDDLPEFDEGDALAESQAEEETDEATAEDVDAIAGEELPELSEDDLLEEAVLEPSELADADESAPAEVEPEDVLAELTDDEALIDEEIDLEDDGLGSTLEDALSDDELPEFSEEDAADSYELDAEDDSEILEQSDGSRLELADEDLPEFGEEDLVTPEPEKSDKSIPRGEFDEKALNELLSEDEASERFSMSQPMDDDFIDSAGMNIDTMLEGMDGEDWNGFKLSPEHQGSLPSDIPEDEQDIWNDAVQTAEPELEDENWSIQESVVDSDPKEKRYMTIDELMAQVDAEGGEFEEQDLKLDVGLNEFPDVIGNISDIDVDSNAEASGKLDLAKIYMEMNDEQGAIKLLEEAIVDGDDSIRQEAKKLIDRINRG